MALTIRIYVSKMMSLLFNMLSKFVIAFLPRSKHLLISDLDFCQITASSLGPEACEILGVPFKSDVCISPTSQVAQW